MSDASTSLADHPAGKAKSLRPPTRRRGPSGGRGRRGLGSGAATRGGRWQAGLWDSTPTSVLLDQAGRLIERRSWRRAIRLLAVAATTTSEPNARRNILQRLAEASADGGHHRISCEAMFELQSLEPRDADTWVTFANVALARGNYHHADAAARKALAQEPDHRGAWVAMAAGYAGLGWFEQSDGCLDHIDRSSLTDRERWRIGRAVNRWSMADSHWLVAAAVSAVLVGLLAVAVAVSVPFLTREWRLRNLRADRPARTFEALAGEAWRFERRLRLGHAVTVVASVVGFISGLVFL